MYITIIVTLIIKAFKCKGGGGWGGKGKGEGGRGTQNSPYLLLPLHTLHNGNKLFPLCFLENE